MPVTEELLRLIELAKDDAALRKNLYKAWDEGHEAGLGWRYDNRGLPDHDNPFSEEST